MKLRILASGDHHYCERIRFEECCRVHEWMVDVARREKVKLFLSSGDVYEGASTPIERHALADWVRPMAELGPMVFAKGNHDRPLDCALLARLRTKHPVIVEERAGVHVVAGAAVAAMAWPERTSLLIQSGSQEATDTLMREALQSVLRGLGDQLEQHDGPRILLGHFMVDGSEASAGQPLIGMPINVGLADLALARAHVGVMGHIHKAQRWDVGGAPHIYTGSPFRTDFGQLERKSVLLLEFDGQTLTRLEEIETPCTPMLHLEDEWGFSEELRTDDWLAGLHGYGGPETVRGAEVRFRYTVAVHKQEAAKAAAESVAETLRAQGAVLVKTEPVVKTERRARAPEVARAQTIREKLPAHWRSVAFDPGDREAAMLTKASELEAEIHVQQSAY